MEEIKALLREFLERVEGKLDIDHDQLVKLNASLALVVEQQEVRISDHEGRIRFLERYAWLLIGGSVVIIELMRWLTGK